MADIKDTELAYFAGFFDGEGCVAAYRKKYVVSLTNTDIRPLKRAQELWGGFISMQTKESRTGAVQDLWRWQIYGHNSRDFLNAILPFVLIKREQVDVYLTILSVLPNKPVGSRGHTKKVSETINFGADQLRQLKRKGVEHE